MAGKQADIKVGVLTHYDDKGLKSAETGLKGFKSSVAEADGMGGKFKAGWGSAVDSVKAHAGTLALAGGAALVAFGVKAVGAFTDVAKAALDLGTATGLSTEDASRWIAVADDMGVSAEALTSGIGKIAKTLDDTKWAEFGVATRDAGGEARDVNDILLDTFDRLGKIKNETERAAKGNELFGKGYASLAPMIGKSRAEMEKYLGAVEKGQVITDKEAAKAEKMRLAQDALKDALGEVTLALGGVVSGMAPLIENAAGAITKIAELAEGLDKLTASGGGIGGIGDWGLVGIGKTVTGELDIITEALDMMALKSAETDRETRKISGAMSEVAEATDEAGDAAVDYKADAANTARAVKQNIDEMIGKWAELRGDVEADQSWLTLQGQFDEVKVKFEEANAAIKKGLPEAEQLTRDYAMALNDLTLDTISYGEKVAGIPAEKVTLIKAAILAGDIEEAERMLAILTRNREINIGLIGLGAAGYGGVSGARASGGPVRAGGNYLVGERGPEVVHMNGAGTVIPNGAGGPVNVTINMPPGSNGDDVVRAIKKFEARNGPGWRAS